MIWQWGKTAATQAKRRWNAGWVGMPHCQIIGKTRDADTKVKRIRLPPEYLSDFKCLIYFVFNKGNTLHFLVISGGAL